MPYKFVTGLPGRELYKSRMQMIIPDSFMKHFSCMLIYLFAGGGERDGNKRHSYFKKADTKNGERYNSY